MYLFSYIVISLLLLLAIVTFVITDSLTTIGNDGEKSAIERYFRYFRGESGVLFKATTIAIFGIFLLICGILYYFYYDGIFKDYIIGIATELGGFVFDLLLVGILFTIINNKQQERSLVRDYKNIIEDYIHWNSDESKIRVFGTIKRLNNLGVYDIKLTHAKLSKITDASSENIVFTIHLKGANFTSAEFADQNLTESTFLDCTSSDAILTGCILFRTKFNNSRIQNVNLTGSKCNSAEFKNTIFSGDCNFSNTDLKHCNFDGATGVRVNFNMALVDKDFVERFGAWSRSAREQDRKSVV